MVVIGLGNPRFRGKSLVRMKVMKVMKGRWTPSFSFLASNTEILYEMFDEWGWKPKPTVPKIQREAGNNLSTMQNLTRSIVMFFWGKFLY